MQHSAAAAAVFALSGCAGNSEMLDENGQMGTSPTVSGLQSCTE